MKKRRVTRRRVDPSIKALRRDLEAERKVLRAKTRVLEILEKMPNDIERRRTMIAVAALCGMYD